MAQKKSISDYKNRMMTKSTPQGDTRIRFTLTAEQYERAQGIAKRSGLSIDELLHRYITKCIADLHHP